MKKSFDEFYEEIKNNNELNIKNPYKKCICIGTFLVIFSFLVFILAVKYSMIFLVIGLVLIFDIAGIIYSLKEFEKYERKFKDIFLPYLVRLYNNKLTYNKVASIDKNIYNNSKLPSKFDEFYSSDEVFGYLYNNLLVKFSYIKTNINKKSVVEGNTVVEKINNYYGIFGYTVCSKNINAEINIKKNDLKKNLAKNRIELESIEFEKEFDCFANNKIVALQVLKPELIDKITNLNNILKCPLEINIINNMIYFRVMINDIFVAPKFKMPINKEYLRKLYNAIDVCYELMECISNSVNNI